MILSDSSQAVLMRLHDDFPNQVGCPVVHLDEALDAGDPLRPAVIAIGAFDGVHLGHRRLIDAMVADARSRGVSSVIVTFDPDPDVVVSASPAPKLLSVGERLAALSRCGADLVVVVPFDRVVASMDHDRFLGGLLGRAFDIRAIHVGANFRLGAQGASNVDVIRSWGADHAIQVFGHHLLLGEGSDAPISASRIRAAVGAGELALAGSMLGRDFTVRGRVVHGRGEGTAMGFPTANVARDELIQMPADGVYAGWALVEAGGGRTAYPTAINVGLPPMFSDNPASATLEATLIGFAGDLYDEPLQVAFTRRLRPPAHFSSIEELIRAVQANISEVAALYGDTGIDL